MADTNTRATAGAPPERLATQARSHGSAVRVLIRRDDAGEARWCVAQYATAAFAAAGGMTLEDYRAFLGRALLLDRVDPVAAWREVEAYQSRVVDALMPMQEFHVRGPGTDIHLRTTGRTWISAHGTHNLPDGEVFTGAARGRDRGRRDVRPARDVAGPARRRRAAALQRRALRRGRRARGRGRPRSRRSTPTRARA